MKTKKETRLDRCEDLLREVRSRSRRGIAINVKDIAREFTIKGNILNDAEKFGMIAKSGDGYRFLKNITLENVLGVINYSSEIDKKGRERRKKESKLPNLFTPAPEPTMQKATPEMMLSVVKHFREHPDMIDSMLRLLQEQLEDQFNLV